MDEDCKMWLLSPTVRQLKSMRTDRGKNRYMKASSEKIDVDPVQIFKNSIEQLQELMLDIKQKEHQKDEQFINLDSSKLR